MEVAVAKPKVEVLWSLNDGNLWQLGNWIPVHLGCRMAVEFLEECSVLVEQVHLVGIPPAEVESLAQLRGIALFARWPSGNIVDNWSHSLDRGWDLNIGVVDVDRDVCSTSKPCAWVICPVVGTTKGNGLWVVEVVHAAEE